MKSRILLLYAVAVACGVGAVSCTPEEDVVDMKELKPIFSSNEFSVEAGGTIALTFAISNVEGAELELTASASNPEATVSVTHDNLYQGEVMFTAPAVSSGESITVTLEVNDAANGRSASTTTTVTVGASESLSVSLSADIRSMATKPGGSFELPFIISGKGKAEISTEPEITVTDGWTATCTLDEDQEGGSITVTAPAALTADLAVKMEISDNYRRTATLDIKLSIVEVSNTENAANCYIVSPGSTISIKAVEGNSADELTFNNASLVWQDEPGMVKSVAASPADKAIVVTLNPGISGNAVVAARQDDEIVWSWHLWVTDYDPEDNPMVYTSPKTSTTYTFMDRNLGAMSGEKYTAESFGLLYQWGRKDPFVGADGTMSSVYVKKYDIDGNQVREVSEERPVYGSDDYESTNLELSIRNPHIFYTAPSSAWPVVDWLTDDAQRQNNDLWGGVSGYKSKYDPCPEGWIVPQAGDPWLFRSEYSKEGSLNDSGKYDSSYPWYIEYDDAYCIGFRYKAAGSDTEYWFPFCGEKDCNGGALNSVGSGSQYHTRTTSNTTVLVQCLAWGNPTSEMTLNRPYGSSVRCIKE